MKLLCEKCIEKDAIIDAANKVILEASEEVRQATATYASWAKIRESLEARIKDLEETAQAATHRNFRMLDQLMKVFPTASVASGLSVGIAAAIGDHQTVIEQRDALCGAVKNAALHSTAFVCCFWLAVCWRNAD